MASAPPVQDAGYQTMIEAEPIDEFVHEQTTRNRETYQQDVDELNLEDKKIERFIRNGEKNRFTNVACFDEILDRDNEEFYVHANTFSTPYGNFIISQAPKENTCGDHLHLMWIYNVRTVVCLVSPEEAGGYFVPKEGESFTVFQKYTMKTTAIFDEKQGITVYQCEMKSWKAPKAQSRRTVYIICCDTAVAAVRSPRQQTAIMEYMWAFEETEDIEKNGTTSDATTTVLVHGLAGTRRCTSFVVTTIMCRQILETGQFSAMETWQEMRKRRAHSCTRKHDFYSSLYTVFAFAIQCCTVSESDPNYMKTMQIMKELLEKRQNRDKDGTEDKSS
uniref:Tyrosine-protein phosphatase domain-containing protein n=1 Tax=Caenorhabditis tropicalis TaxID=1561998 RepID=A0A1I7U5V2_9PELO